MRVAGIHLDVPGKNKLDPEPEEPIGLEYVLAAVQRAGHEVRLFIEWYGAGQLLDELVKYDPDVALLEVYSKDFPGTTSLATRLKEWKRDLFVVVGGYHPTALPHQTLAESGNSFDVAVIGEGEETIQEVLRVFEAGGNLDGVRGIAYWENGTIRINPPRELIPDLDSIPWPVREPRFYDLPKKGCLFYPESSRLRYAPIVSSRGCTRYCYFCSSSNMWRRKPRFRSPTDVVREMNHLHRSYGINMFFIEDLSINVEEVRLRTLCNEMEKYLDDGIYWSSCANVGVSKGLLLKMKNARCVCLSYGVETVNPNVLKSQNKFQNVNEIKRTLIATADAGIMNLVFYMIGFENENEDTIKESFNCLYGLPIHRLRLTIATPFPGSPWYDKIDKSTLDSDWSKYDTMHPVSASQHISKRKLSTLRDELIKAYYYSKEYKRIVEQFLSKNMMFAKSFKEFYETIEFSETVIDTEVCQDQTNISLL